MPDLQNGYLFYPPWCPPPYTPHPLPIPRPWPGPIDPIQSYGGTRGVVGLRPEDFMVPAMTLPTQPTPRPIGPPLARIDMSGLLSMARERLQNPDPVVRASGERLLCFASGWLTGQLVAQGLIDAYDVLAELQTNLQRPLPMQALDKAAEIAVLVSSGETRAIDWKKVVEAVKDFFCKVAC